MVRCFANNDTTYKCHDRDLNPVMTTKKYLYKLLAEVDFCIFPPIWGLWVEHGMFNLNIKQSHHICRNSIQ